MTWHWWHIGISYAVVVGGFGLLAILVLCRLRDARRRLQTLESR